MQKEKNIDRLFQEKFKDFEVLPNDTVWDRISTNLPKKKKKRRVVALWWQVGGVAAVIALLLTVGTSVFNTSNDNKIIPEIVDSEKTNTNTQENNSSNAQDANGKFKDNTKPHLEQNTNKSSTLVNSTDKQNKKSSTPQKNLTEIRSENNNAMASSDHTDLEEKSNDDLINHSEMKSAIKDAVENKNSAVVSDNTTSKDIGTKTEKTLEKETAIQKDDPSKVSILDAIADRSKDIDEKEKEDEQNRWSVAPNVAPVYYSSLGQGSSIDQQFNNNSKSSDINMSYGITGAYAISEKIKVRTGIHRVALSQSTSNVLAFGSGEFASRNAEASIGNINAKAGLENVTLMSANMFNRNATPEVFNTKITGNIDQRFGFIEVPLELEYRVLDKKLGLNVIGGFSTFFLNQNEIYADIEGVSTLIGEASNINSTSFSANFGLGLDYSLSKHWNINLEPQFKYQISTFNNTSGNYRPFFVGLYTGLSFKF